MSIHTAINRKPMTQALNILSLLILMLIPGLSFAQDLTLELPNVIVTPAPAPKEVIIEPEGYVNCTTLSAGWRNNVWYPERRVCNYTSTATKVYAGTAWVGGHWSCTQYKIVGTNNGECTSWDWVPGHWVKTLEGE